MKKIFTLISLLFVAGNLLAQTTLVEENFTSYVGDQATQPAGWAFKNISSIATNNFYTSPSSCGPSGANSFKFYAQGSNVMGPTLITPYFANADALTFWFKGNSTVAGCIFTVVAVDDTINPTVIDTLEVISPLPTTGTAKTYTLASNVHYVTFSYFKAAGNVAFDDVKITSSGTPTVIFKKAIKTTVNIYPNPSNNGLFTIDGLTNESSIIVYNAIGESVWTKSNIADSKVRVDLMNLPQGVYIARVKNNGAMSTYKLIKN